MLANLLGVMQGRLLPKYKGRYQAFPVGYWADEFPKAAGLGLDCIEFILDAEDASENPLLRPDGPDEILRVSKQTGVRVRTICADYFMDVPLHAPDAEVAENAHRIAQSLVCLGPRLGVTDIVIPCVDRSSLADLEAQERLEKALVRLIPLAETHAVNLCLETDLSPRAFGELLMRLDSPRVTVNYDTGNSAALGFDPAEELACYGRRISDIHIKDRVRDGGSVVLGSGDVDFDRFFDALRPLDYAGPIIMQAFRDDEGMDIFREQLDWMRERYLEGTWI